MQSRIIHCIDRQHTQQFTSSVENLEPLWAVRNCFWAECKYGNGRHHSSWPQTGTLAVRTQLPISPRPHLASARIIVFGSVRSNFAYLEKQSQQHYN